MPRWVFTLAYRAGCRSCQVLVLTAAFTSKEGNCKHMLQMVLTPSLFEEHIYMTAHSFIWIHDNTAHIVRETGHITTMERKRTDTGSNKSTDTNSNKTNQGSIHLQSSSRSITLLVAETGGHCCPPPQSSSLCPANGIVSAHTACLNCSKHTSAFVHIPVHYIAHSPMAIQSRTSDMSSLSTDAAHVERL